MFLAEIGVTWLGPPDEDDINLEVPEIGSIGAEYTADVALSQDWLDEVDIVWDLDGTTDDTIAAVNSIDPASAYLSFEGSTFRLGKNTLDASGVYSLTMTLVSREFDIVIYNVSMPLEMMLPP